MVFRNFAILAVLFLSLTCAAQEKKNVDWSVKCKLIENTIAEVAKSNQYSLNGVKKIQKSNSEIQGCNDGFYAEGMTDIVVKSLAADFKNIVTSAISNNGLEEFLTKHINSSADWNDLDRVVANAYSSCEPKAKTLCKRIAELSKRSSEEAKAVVKQSK